MKEILKSFGIGAAVAGALVGGSYAAARAIDGAERLCDHLKDRKAKKEAEAAPADTTKAA